MANVYMVTRCSCWKCGKATGACRTSAGCTPHNCISESCRLFRPRVLSLLFGLVGRAELRVVKMQCLAGNIPYQGLFVITDCDFFQSGPTLLTHRFDPLPLHLGRVSDFKLSESNMIKHFVSCIIKLTPFNASASSWSPLSWVRAALSPRRREGASEAEVAEARKAAAEKGQLSVFETLPEVAEQERTVSTTRKQKYDHVRLLCLALSSRRLK